MTIQNIIEKVQLHFPKVIATMALKDIEAAQKRFIKEGYAYLESAQVIIGGTVLAGSSGVSPVTLSSNTSFSLLAYYDDTVDSITILPSTTLYYYVSIVQRDPSGNAINVISTDIALDGTITIYDENGDSLQEFPANLEHLDIMYIGKPAALVNMTDALVITEEDYQEALAFYILARMYPLKEGMVVTDKLMMAKHYDNLYQEQVRKSRNHFRKNFSLIPVSGMSETFQH